MEYLAMSAVMMVNASVPIAEPYQPLTITHAPEDQTVEKFGAASFFCEVTGNPAPDRIFWRRSGIRVDESSYSQYVIHVPGGSVYRMDTVLGDTTTIDCVAESDETGDSVTSTAMLIVYEYNEAPSGFPEITQHPRISVVEEGRSKIQTCEATGDPAPTFKWFKDFIPIDMGDPRFTLLNTGALLIDSVQSSDEGSYECAAENSVGVAFSYSSTLYVRVRRVAPHFFVLPESSVEIPRGGSTQLNCVAAGSPMPIVKWREDSSDVNEVVSSSSLGSGELHLSNIQESRVYTCVAESEIGLVEAHTEIIVTEPEDDWL